MVAWKYTHGGNISPFAHGAKDHDYRNPWEEYKRNIPQHKHGSLFEPTQHADDAMVTYTKRSIDFGYVIIY